MVSPSDSVGADIEVLAMGAFFGVVIGVFAIVVIFRSIYIVRQFQRGLVETFGKYAAPPTRA